MTGWTAATVTAPSGAAATPLEAVGACAKGAAQGLAGGLAAEFLIGVAAGAAGVSAGALAATVGFLLLPVAIYEIASHWDEITSGVDRLVPGRGTVKDFEATGDVVGGILSMRAAGPAAELGAELGQAIRVEAADAIATLAPELATAGPALIDAPAPSTLQSTGGVARPNTPRPLPALDATGKVHGDLPKASELGEHSADDLRQLLGELKQSVQERIRKTVELGPHKPHGERQAAEQELIRQIESNLKRR